MATKAEGGTIVIPELEDLIKNRPLRAAEWSDRDIKILESYYGRMRVSDLAEYLGRTMPSVEHKARRLGLTGKDSNIR